MRPSRKEKQRRLRELAESEKEQREIARSAYHFTPELHKAQERNRNAKAHCQR